MARLRGERRMTMAWVTAVVLRDDVEQAVRSIQIGHHAATHCPIARALCRVLGLPLGHVAVAYDVIEVYDWKEYELVEGVPTRKMVRAMERFDETGGMTPAAFRITLAPVADA
jgi:hypothetical protein